MQLIVVGEALRRVMGKCLCIMARVKASEFFWPISTWCGLSIRSGKVGTCSAPGVLGITGRTMILWHVRWT